MTWTTPTGHTHTTYPLDRLHGITLPATPTEPHTEPHRPEPTRRPPEPAFSRLEYELEHRCPPTTTKHARDLRRLRRHGHTHETIPTPRPGHPHLILTFTTTNDPGPPPF